MSNAIMQLPPRYRSVPSIERMANQIDRYKGRSRGLREKASDGLGLVESAASMGLGAALAGWAMGKGYSDTTIAAAGAATLALGFSQRSPVMVEAGKGILAPLVALWAARQATGTGGANVNAAQHEAAAAGG